MPKCSRMALFNEPAEEPIPNLKTVLRYNQTTGRWEMPLK